MRETAARQTWMKSVGKARSDALALYDGATSVCLAASHNTPVVRQWLAHQTGAPAQDRKFVPNQAVDSQATGIQEHITRPHARDIQSELGLGRKLRRAVDRHAAEADPTAREAAE